MDNHPLPLAFCCDRNVVDGLVTTIASAAVALRRGYFLDIHVLDCGLGADLRQQVANLVQSKLPLSRIEFIELPAERLQQFPRPTRLNYVTLATYGRLFLHELLPGIDRILYLDTDILVTGDLAELFLTSLDSAPFAAVRDVLIRNVGSELESLMASVPGLSPDEPYFSAGVLLMDLKRLRELDASTLYARAARSSEPRFGDQSLLNALFHGQWKILPAKWNRQIKLSDHYSVFADEPRAIWHFAGRSKPWHFPRRPARGLLRQWQRARDAVGWTPTVVPTIKAHPSFHMDCLKQVRSWIRTRA